jgi:PIN domain nuclease of toxin-antitoxin system
LAPIALTSYLEAIPRRKGLIVASALSQNCRLLLSEDLQDGQEIDRLRIASAQLADLPLATPDEMIQHYTPHSTSSGDSIQLLA